jgi:hypothetical protein
MGYGSVRLWRWLSQFVPQSRERVNFPAPVQSEHIAEGAAGITQPKIRRQSGHFGVDFLGGLLGVA